MSDNVTPPLLSEAELLARFSKTKPPFMDVLGGEFIAADAKAGTATFLYTIGHNLCHSGGIVQGGFVTAMLDAAMAHAIFAVSGYTLRPPTLEIKVSFFEPAHPGKLKAVARLIRRGKSIAFLEADLYDEAGTLLARGTSTVKLVPLERNK